MEQTRFVEGVGEKVLCLASLALIQAGSSFTHKLTLAFLSVNLFYVLIVAEVLSHRVFLS